MRTYATKNIRQLLREHPDGLTTKAIAERVGTNEEAARKRLHEMPDTYIDRWDGPRRGQYAAVWCVVIPPDNCPHPTGGVVAVRPSRRKDFAADAPVNRTREIND